MARKNAKNTAAQEVSYMEQEDLERAMNEANVVSQDAPSVMTDEELLKALEVEVAETPAVNVAQATAEANGFEANANQTPAVEEPAPAANSGEPPTSFVQVLDNITTEQVEMMRAALLISFGARAQYEIDQDSGNDNIQKTLSKELAKHQLPGILKALVAADVDANYVNVSEMGNKRRNVYALQKLSDLLYGAVTGHIKNAINLACVTSMARLKDTALPFTGEVAKACASDKTAVGNDYKAIIQRHTVAESTASTQASSTMTALEVLGVVSNVGTRNHPVYKLTGTALANRLVEIVMKPAAVSA